MKPLDPALIRRVGSVRRLLVTSTVLRILGTLALVVQAVAIARILAGAIDPADGKFAFPTTDLVLLATAVLARTAVGALTERVAGRAAGAAIGQLRMQVLTAVARRPSRTRAGSSTAELQPLLTRGLDGLHAYLGSYLPALVQAAIVPAAVVVVLLAVDPLSALIVGVTLPLVPLFMSLIGWYTQTATRDSLLTVQRLAGRFADVVAGLPALVVFGRVRAQARSVGAAAEEHRVATARTLRVAFLSSMVLELVATLSVALVAVTCGIRLVGGGMPIQTALIVLLLAPEAYLPLRAVGAGFHAAADGAAAVEQSLSIIDEPGRKIGTRTDSAAVPGLRIEGAGLDFADGRRLTVGSHQFPAGQITVVSGPSGSGKSTLLNLLAGQDSADRGRVLVDVADRGAVDLRDVDLRHWRSRIGWLGQRVALRPGTLRENLTAGRAVTPALMDRVVTASCLGQVLAELPDGMDTVVGPGARDLSTGQRRRVGLARALLADAPVLLLDEPTEGLDEATEHTVLQGIRPLLAGRTVVVTTHRPAVLELADRRIVLAGDQNDQREPDDRELVLA
ncbi:thiol reductant ABC exporter subunit CydD [Nakamurella lactea]|uniref:thiol reductant ABC exporter subunit CydD n=1 Tax=Nakamurella lactea TaxID=459515 RepID=UPI001378BD70|nr:thiol reductant ABC exporter subunit CydD [Nakamurella lactea]